MAKTLSTIPCSVLKGVGAKLNESLIEAGIDSLEALLFHLPLRYQDRTRITPVADLLPGHYAVSEGIVQSTRTLFGKRRSLQCELADLNGDVLQIRFFHYSNSQKQRLELGLRVRVFGLVRRWGRQAEMIHPEYQFIEENVDTPVDVYLTPIYPQLANFSQKVTRQLIDQALGYLDENAITELLSKEQLGEYSLISLKEALHMLHRPSPEIRLETLEDPNHPARLRLAFEELLAQRLALRAIRRQKACLSSTALLGDEALMQDFIGSLPFALTQAQSRVMQEIQHDLAKSTPMQRLLQGDVGSGKTVVAACACLQAASSGVQVAVMAPTEILAEQLFTHFYEWLTPFTIKVDFLVGSHSQKKRQPILKSLASGDLQVLVGTHALFQESVVFKNLNFIIIDEQHRFGVKQRLALQQKGESADKIPHQLIMTATPIPRSLAMTAYAELDLSVIDTLPPGRTPIKTVAIEMSRRLEVIERIRHVVDSGQQVYWVCTLIEISETLQCQAATETYGMLQSALPNMRVGLVHGQMKADEKDAVMQTFKRGELQLLVATTVIEVGVNVPNASLMVIENSERLGLSQLHQLRGRVGRGTLESYCVLLYQKPLNDIARRRLDIMRETTDGFKIADEDLALRGPGDFLGTQQTGMAQFRIADIIQHKRLLPQVVKVAAEIEKRDPTISLGLISRWYRHAEEYAKV